MDFLAGFTFFIGQFSFDKEDKVGSEKSKKPKTKGKNRLFIGDLGGITLSPKIMKTWDKIMRKPFYGPKKSYNSNTR